MNKDLRPEDFWPEAESLLDKHYKAKRNRRAILWFITALTIIGASLYFTADRHENAVVVSESGKQNNTQLNNSSAETNTNPQNNINVQSNESINSNNNSNTNTTPTPATEMVRIENEKNVIQLGKTKSTKTISKPATIVGSSLAISTAENSIPVSQQVLIDQKSISTETSSTATQNLLIENSAIASLSTPIFEGMNIDKVSFQNAATRNTQIKEPKISGAAEYRFDFLIGANLMTKEISGYSNPITEGKRNAGEKDIVTPQLSLEVSRVTENYSIALGLNYIQYGEKVNYDPTMQTKIAIDNSYWNTFTTNVVDTDTNYVYGFVYFSEQMTQRLDSNYVTQTDSLDQTVINNNILKSTGTNVISYVEMPISLSYYFGKKKFRYGISAGVSAGMLVYSNGYYLNNSGTDVINIQEEKLFRKVIFNGQVGLDFRYCLSPKMHLLFRPQYRMNLDSIIKEEAGFKQKYSSFGVNAGVSFLIK